MKDTDNRMAELYFKQQVDAGLKELDEGKGIPHEEVEKRMFRWLKDKMVAIDTSVQTEM